MGWCGTARGTAPFRSHIGNDGYSGFGVILEDGTNYAVKSTAVNTDGKGTDQANWLAWVTTYWWNASTDRPYAWVVEFSTAGLSSDRVSLIMSVQSGRATLNAGPYFWKVQWSATGDYESDEGWFDVEAAQFAAVLLGGAAQHGADRHGSGQQHRGLQLDHVHVLHDRDLGLLLEIHVVLLSLSLIHI